MGPVIGVIHPHLLQVALQKPAVWQYESSPFVITYSLHLFILVGGFNHLEKY